MARIFVPRSSTNLRSMDAIWTEDNELNDDVPRQSSQVLPL